MNKFQEWRDRLMGGPAFPRVDRPGRDGQWAEFLIEKRGGEWNVIPNVDIHIHGEYSSTDLDTSSREIEE